MIDPNFWRSETLGWIGLVLCTVTPLAALYLARHFARKL